MDALRTGLFSSPHILIPPQHWLWCNARLGTKCCCWLHTWCQRLVPAPDQKKFSLLNAFIVSLRSVFCPRIVQCISQYIGVVKECCLRVLLMKKSRAASIGARCQGNQRGDTAVDWLVWHRLLPAMVLGRLRHFPYSFIVSFPMA